VVEGLAGAASKSKPSLTDHHPGLLGPLETELLDVEVVEDRNGALGCLQADVAEPHH
jgi:hypothetical protein